MIRTPGSHMDLATGAQTTRCQSLRLVSSMDQMPTKHKWQQRVNKMTGDHRHLDLKPSALDGKVERENGETGGGGIVKQYRITSRQHDDSDENLTSMNRLKRKMEGDNFLTTWTNNYLQWTFRATFMEVLFVTSIFFMVFITIFAIMIFWIDRGQPECISGVDRDENAHINFVDAYHLSWTVRLPTKKKKKPERKLIFFFLNHVLWRH